MNHAPLNSSTAALHPAQPPQRTLTELDHVRLSRLLERHADDAAEALEEALAHCALVPSPHVAPDVVTMYSRVCVRDEHGHDAVYTLCYPTDAEPAEGFVSVLSPLGAALLGARRGEAVEFLRPDRRTARLQLLQILFQPEATGDYTT
jgi:regulator of nucleoside diphosphate kinase